MLDDLIGIAHEAAADIAGESVTVTQSGQTCSIDGVLFGRSQFTVDDGGGVFYTETTDLDFLILVSSYKPGGQAAEPAEKATIAVTSGNLTGKVFEVLPAAGGKCFDFDRTGTRYRIHTKRIA